MRMAAPMRSATWLRRRGFTLIEMMVAVALAMIMMSVVIVVFGQAIELFLRMDATSEALHSAQVAIDFLEKDIQTATLEVQKVFIGVTDTSKGRINNNYVSDSVADEDTDTIGEDNDCYDFKNIAGKERHGLEMVSMSLYAMDSKGQPVTGEHVIYYLTRDETTDGGHEMGRLIRFEEDRTATPVSVWLNGPASVLDIGSLDTPQKKGLGKQKEQTLAFGVVQFRLRYFYQGTWYNEWDSTDIADVIQFRTLPEVVEVALKVVDTSGYLDRKNNSPFVIQRLIAVVPESP